MGMVILSFTIKDMRDDVEHLESLGKAQTAIVRFNHIHSYNVIIFEKFNLWQSCSERSQSPLKTIME